MGNNTFAFKLNKIITGQFAVIKDNLDRDSNRIGLSSSTSFSANENKTVAVTVNFKFSSDKGIFMIIEVSCIFGFDESTWKSFSSEEGDKLIIPVKIATHLLVLTVGTARGVLHAKTENTKFNKYFLPTINVSKNIKEDVTLVLNKNHVNEE